MFNLSLSCLSDVSLLALLCLVISPCIATQLPQLTGTPTLTPNTTSIMVSWNHPQYFPDSYTVSYSCQLLCDSQTPSVQTNTVTGIANNHTIYYLISGSSCTVSVTAVFCSSGSDTIISSTNTSTAGITHVPVISDISALSYVSPSSPYWCSRRLH